MLGGVLIPSVPPFAGAWRTTPFRLALGFGAAFVLGVALLLAVVYVRTAGYLSQRVDRIVASEARTLAEAGPDRVLDRLDLERRRDPLNVFALYAESGQQVFGPSWLDVAKLPADGAVGVLAGGGGGYRGEAVRLPWGETLVVARDTAQLEELRRVLLQALLGGGAAIAASGIAAGFLLGLDPVRRLQAIRAESLRIVGGDLAARLPVGPRGDEIDALADIVNEMMGEMERLMLHARTAGESIAHELRTPLTRLRATLEHAAGDLPPDDPRRAMLERCVAEADGVLDRFRALLRIAAVEAKRRSAAIAPTDLSDLIEQVGELYQPLAEARGLDFVLEAAGGVQARADGGLLFEALANLVDNAIKFTPPGGRVSLALRRKGDGAVVEVGDTGPGIAPEEIELITRRFYRSAQHQGVPGHGLGLSLVAAVADLHGFRLSFASRPGATTATLELPPA